DAGSRRLHAFVRHSASHTSRATVLDKMYALFCSKRLIGSLDQGDPPEIRIPWCARLVLVHDVAKANPPIQVRKANGAPGPWMPEGERVGPERRDARAGYRRLLGHRQREPEPEARREGENRLGTG